jgi:hypothetical protein
MENAEIDARVWLALAWSVGHAASLSAALWNTETDHDGHSIVPTITAALGSLVPGVSLVTGVATWLWLFLFRRMPR